MGMTTTSREKRTACGRWFPLPTYHDRHRYMSSKGTSLAEMAVAPPPEKTVRYSNAKMYCRAPMTRTKYGEAVHAILRGTTDSDNWCMAPVTSRHLQVPILFTKKRRPRLAASPAEAAQRRLGAPAGTAKSRPPEGILWLGCSGTPLPWLFLEPRQKLQSWRSQRRSVKDIKHGLVSGLQFFLLCSVLSTGLPRDLESWANDWKPRLQPLLPEPKKLTSKHPTTPRPPGGSKKVEVDPPSSNAMV